MPQLAKSRTMAVTTRISEAEYCLLEDRMRATGASMADILRPFIQQGLAALTGGEEDEEEEIDYAQKLWYLFAETVWTALQPKTAQHQLTQQTFRAYCERRLPGTFKD